MNGLSIFSKISLSATDVIILRLTLSLDQQIPLCHDVLLKNLQCQRHLSVFLFDQVNFAKTSSPDHFAEYKVAFAYFFVRLKHILAGSVIVAFSAFSAGSLRAFLSFVSVDVFDFDLTHDLLFGVSLHLLWNTLDYCKVTGDLGLPPALGCSFAQDPPIFRHLYR